MNRHESEDQDIYHRPNLAAERSIPGKISRLAILNAIHTELKRAYDKHGRDQWGRHEFYAILKEEFDELWDTIKSDADQIEVRTEALQIATVIFRYLETADRYREPVRDSSTSLGMTETQGKGEQHANTIS